MTENYDPFDVKELQEILDDYKVGASVMWKDIGPRVTQYVVSLPDGGKISSIKRIEQEIALLLGVVSVRVFPIPSIPAVGIEVPNEKPETVKIKDILNDSHYETVAQLAKASCSFSKIPFGIGKNAIGNVIIGDLKEMPHLLVAGQTGAGKSMFLNTLIISLLKNSTPKNCILCL